MTYQEDKTTNLLISALNCFDIGVTVHDEIFMNTLGTIMIFALISKLEFHATLTRSHINRLFLLPLHHYLQLDHPRTSTLLLYFSQLELQKNPTPMVLIKEKVLSSNNSFTLGFVMS